MAPDRELVDKWRAHVFEPSEREVRRLVAQFPERRQFPVSFTQYGIDYRFTEPLVNDPDRSLEAARTALAEFVGDEFDAALDADDRVYFRLSDVPSSARYSLEEIRADHLNRLVAVEATVESCGELRPRIVTAVFRCDRCGEECSAPQRGRRLRDRTRCPACTAVGTLDLVPEKCEYVDSQEIRVGTAGGDRTLPVALEHDLAGAFEPGQVLELVAIPRGRADGERTTVELELEGVNVASVDSTSAASRTASSV